MSYGTPTLQTFAAPAAPARECVSPAGAYTRGDAATYAGLVGGASLVLTLARVLRPAAAGFGTHRQLGLPPCPFMAVTGLPCPGCGLTTSFAHMARLDFTAALGAQPFGVYAFLLTLLLIPFSVYLMRRRVPLRQAFELRAVRFVLRVTPPLLAAGWLYKLSRF